MRRSRNVGLGPDHAWLIEADSGLTQSSHLLQGMAVQPEKIMAFSH
jgi:hypothetical protein